MVLPQVRLRVLPQLVVVLAPDYLATDTRNLLHTLIVRRNLGMLDDERFAKYAPAILASTTDHPRARTPRLQLGPDTDKEHR